MKLARQMDHASAVRNGLQHDPVTSWAQYCQLSRNRVWGGILLHCTAVVYVKERYRVGVKLVVCEPDSEGLPEDPMLQQLQPCLFLLQSLSLDITSQLLPHLRTVL